MIIGITGNSGSGKTTVSQILSKEYNTKIIDADKIVKQLSGNGQEYLKKIVQVFGTELLDEKGNLKRKELAKIIFSDSKKRKKLNSLTQKYVVKEIKKQIKGLKEENIILDVPLLFESKLNKQCNFTIGVIADEEIKVKRICARDKITKEEALNRLKSQTREENIRKNADFIIENNGNILELEEKIKKIVKKGKK